MTAAIKRKVALIEDGKGTGSGLSAGLFSSIFTFHVNRHRLSAAAGLDSEVSPLRVSSYDFLAAVESFHPSISDQELQRYRDIQNQLTAK